MKQRALLAYLALVVLLSTTFLVGIRFGGKVGLYVGPLYMLVPALAALVTRLFFYEIRFGDAHLRLGRLRHWLLFYGLSLGVTVLSFLLFTVLGSVRWDFSGSVFLAALDRQMALTGKSIADLPPGFTPRTMLWLFCLGGLTVFNVLPGLITGFGEEFGWRGLLFPLLYRIRPSVAFVAGGAIWFAWHIPLTLVFPNPKKFTPAETALNVVILLIGALFTFIYLAYVYIKSRSIIVASFAHIVLNNAARSIAYFAEVTNQTLANLGLTLAVGLLVLSLYGRGEFRVFSEYFGGRSKAAVATGRNGSGP